jgi:hypothetical protein
MGLIDLFFRTSSRTFHVQGDAKTASQHVNPMELEDAAPGGLPPLVFGSKTGPGQFNAFSPIAAFDARVSVQSDGKGGAFVTETKNVFSPVPGWVFVADKIHDYATSPQDAYFRARKRDG